MREEKRKYLPAEAYRFLVLAALAWRRGQPASKGELAWETRANHYMMTRVLRELAADGLVRAERAPEGWALALTQEGEAFHARHRAYFEATFTRQLAEHYRYGRPPPWAPRP